MKWLCCKRSIMSYKFPYKWLLSDGYPAKGIDYHGLKVFGTFVCGGGSSMGYKLAGFNHLGGWKLIHPLRMFTKQIIIQNICFIRILETLF